MSNPFQSISDEDLARQCQGGDFAAFEELVSRYENRIYSFLLQLGGNAADARDATQNTFARAFRKLDQFDPHRSFASWLFAIARRKGIDAFHSRLPCRGEESLEQMDADSPDELLARRDDAEELWGRARATLPPAQFEALWLRYVEEMKVAQIAAVVGKTQTHVKVLLFRARNTLAKTLEHPAPAPILVPKGADT